MSTVGLSRCGFLSSALVLCFAAMTACGSSVQAAGPIVAGLTLSSTSAQVGQSIVVTATAKNITNSTIASAAMGVEVPMNLSMGTVTQSPSRYRYASVLGKRLVYCGFANLAPGQSVTLQFTVSATASGQYNLRSYARQSYTTTDTFATKTLTVR